ncbi:MAG: hypothetical protein GY913_36010 [Proteobacteria bacterium]|nr:hypothetical protein [Pseudomonadota bacterium]MCP4922337.1 hypothetical protein [Pseudomonadota bacterium]
MITLVLACTSPGDSAGPDSDDSPALVDSLDSPTDSSDSSDSADSGRTGRTTRDRDRDGWSTKAGDCDDGDPTVNPGAPEICGNGVDDDCDGLPGDCSYVGDLDIAEHSYELRGVGESDRSGRIVGSCDVDEDDDDELLIGASFADDLRGRVHIVDTPVTESMSLVHDLVTLSGPEGEGEFGGALAAMDGLLLVGGSETSTVQDRAGAVFVFATDDLIEDRTGDDAWLVLHGVAAGDHAGRTLSVADLDGDSIEDLLVGANGADLGDITDPGAAYVLAGPLTEDTTLDDAVVRVHGEALASWMGSTSGRGDVDGDGVAEFVVSEYAANEGGEDTGLVVIIPGDAEGVIVSSDMDRVVGKYLWTGRGLADPTDMDGDGYADLLIGSPAADSWHANGGAVHVVRGPLTGTRQAADAWATFDGSGGDRFFGDALVAWDQDNDGVPGLAVGTPYHNTNDTLTGAGAVYLWQTVEGGTWTADDADARLAGYTEGQQVGRSLAVVSEGTGDVAPDLLVGMFHDVEYSMRTGARLLPGGGL